MTPLNSQTYPLTEEDLLNAPESNYMNDDQRAFFRAKLLELHDNTLARIQQAKNNIAKPMGLSDENDRASSEEQSAIALRIVDREQKLLSKIEQSLKRLRLGDYGYCLDSGEPIGIPRLLARPTAEVSAEAKVLREMKEHHFYR